MSSKDTSKIKPECLKCNFFNKKAKSIYRCGDSGSCPALFGSQEYVDGRLAGFQGKEIKDCPYKQGSSDEGIWLNGWVNGKRELDE